jgi:hypothetical protein
VVIDSYQAAIAKEVRGAPRLKRRGFNYYLYLEKREGPKVVHEYIGNVESDKAIQVSKSIKKRKEYQALLKKAKANLNDVIQDYSPDQINDILNAKTQKIIRNDSKLNDKEILSIKITKIEKTLSRRKIHEI